MRKLACEYLDEEGNCNAISKMSIAKEFIEKYCQTENFSECSRYQFRTNGKIG